MIDVAMLAIGSGPLSVATVVSQRGRKPMPLLLECPLVTGDLATANVRERHFNTPAQYQPQGGVEQIS